MRELGFPEAAAEAAAAAADRFPLRVTRHWLSLSDPRDPGDPILRQILPSDAELHETDGFADDAVGDLAPRHHAAPGLVHKYPGRALLVATSLCAVNCRFCFRRAYPYDELRGERPALGAALRTIAQDASIREVILSGGDPLALTDRALDGLLRRIEAISHVRRIRVHSRLPVVLPERVTDGLLRVLERRRLPLWLVLHTNHPRELSPEVRGACARLRGASVPLLNQSVLLRGVNDDAAVLADLCESLVDLGVKPYYLHLLDRVRGTAQFEVDEARARALHRELRRRVSGIALPALVRDVAGEPSKTPLG
jgi:EF-P beta-lysylation protein EpmB